MNYILIVNLIKIKCLIFSFNYGFKFQCCMIRFTYSLVRFRDMYVRCMTTQGMQEYLYIACAINFIKFNYLFLDQLKSNIWSLHNGDGCRTDTLDQESSSNDSPRINFILPRQEWKNRHNVGIFLFSIFLIFTTDYTGCVKCISPLIFYNSFNLLSYSFNTSLLFFVTLNKVFKVFFDFSLIEFWWPTKISQILSSAIKNIS